MQFWQLKVEKKEDLLILADLLEEFQHPGAHVVRWLYKKKHWPQKWTHFCLWNRSNSWRTERHNIPKRSILPLTIMRCHDHIQFSTITEAIWYVINAIIYQSPELIDNLKNSKDQW